MPRDLGATVSGLSSSRIRVRNFCILSVACLFMGASSQTAKGESTGNAGACSVIASAESLVCLGATIQLGAAGTPTGGTYSWSGPNGFSSSLQNPMIANGQPSNAGLYVVRYIQDRCVARDSVFVQVGTLSCSIFDPDSLPPQCGSTGNQLCVAASGAVDYAWSLAFADAGWAITGGQGTSCITYTAGAAGMAHFKVVLTSAAGCLDSCTFADSCVAAAPCSVSVSATSACAGGTIQLGAVGSPPGGSYVWTGPNGFFSTLQNPVIVNATSADAGTYVATYYAAPCTTSNSIAVQVDSLSCSIFDPDSLATQCGSTGNQLCVATSGVVDYGWSMVNADPGWAITGGLGTSCITYTSGATGTALFKVVLTSAAGCRDSCFFADSCAVAAPCSVSVAGTAACAGGTIHLSAVGSPPGGYYVWTGPNGFFSTFQNPVIVNPTGADAGTYVATYYAASCTTSNSITVQVDTLGCSIFDPDSLPPQCGSTGNQLCVAASGAVHYAWSLAFADSGWAITAGQGTSCITYTAGASGMAYFKVVLTSAAGCRECTLPVSCPADSGCSVLASADAAMCPGGTIQLSAVGNPPGGSYAWTGPNGFTSSQQNPVIANATASNAGTYDVTYTLGSSCPGPSQPPVLVTRWGGPGSGDGQFSRPRGVAVDAAENVYVVEGGVEGGNHRLQKFASDGTYLTQWGENGTGAGQFRYPAGVAVDFSGNVYVADQFNHRIQKFTSDGAYLAQWGGIGIGDGQFAYPSAVAATASGYIYVSDLGFSSAHPSRIQKFTNAGEFVTSWAVGSIGPLKELVGDLAVGADDDVYAVVYRGGYQGVAPVSRVVVFTHDGVFIREFGQDSYRVATCVAIAPPRPDYPCARVLVGNMRASIITFTPAGEYLSSWSDFAGGSCMDGYTGWPMGIAVGASGSLYVVAEGGKGCSQGHKFAPDVAQCSAQGSVTVALDSLSCAIFDPDSLRTQCGSTGNQLCVAASGAVDYAWSLPFADPGWAITGGQGTSCITYTAGASGMAGFKVVRTSAAGCRDSCVFADSCTGTAGTGTDRPSRFSLSPSSPNPFRVRTSIGFDLARPGPVTLAVYGVDGRLVARPVDGEFREAGHHEVEFRASGLQPGLYFYQLKTPGFIGTRRMVLLK